MLEQDEFSYETRRLDKIPKKANTKECSNYRTIALILHASKVMLKTLKPG